MIRAILGQKLESVQRFTEDNRRIPVTRIKVGPCWLAGLRLPDKDGYAAIQLGFGEKKFKNVNLAQKKVLEKAGFKTGFLYLKEIRLPADQITDLEIGQPLKVEEIFQINDPIQVTGWSKGKGFAGVVKRWGFKGGPKTHGQSDRQRSPGAISSGTTPGRVRKGKKMAGRMGNEKVTIKGLKVYQIFAKGESASGEDQVLEITGLIPGSKKGFLIIQKNDLKS